MKKPNLDRVSILLVDSDVQIAKIIIASLKEMGFRKIHHVQTSTDALIYISKQTVDILITEWLLEPMNGIEMVKHLRLSKTSPNRGIHIIMLTGKGELIDVTTARDVGITEFLVKPFTIQNLYDRLAYLVDHPRGFVLSQHFAGPDRRRRAASEAAAERRKIIPKSIVKVGRILPVPSETPLIIPPNHDIKHIIGLTVPLSSLITPEMLASAQKFLEESHDDNFLSLKADLDRLEQAYYIIKNSPADKNALGDMQTLAMAIKARSGTFGFAVPSQIARLLYLFLETDYSPQQELHNVVIQQCIEAIKVIFANEAIGQTDIAHQLVQELQQLIERVRKS